MGDHTVIESIYGRYHKYEIVREGVCVMDVGKRGGCLPFAPF
jgi:hypothetical protein